MPRNNLKNRSVPRQARPHLHASMHVLASAAVLVLTSAPALADPAATLDYRTARIGGTDAWLTQYTVPYSSSYVDWIVAQQDQRGNLSSLAQASGGASGIFAATIGVASGVSGGTPTTLVDSVIRATTVGNQKPATLDLALLANSGLKEGLGISVGQVMGGGVSGGAPLAVSATARAVDNQVAITQQYLPAATLVEQLAQEFKDAAAGTQAPP